MPYLPTPGPVPTLDDGPFWDACRQCELRFQRCARCRRFRHPPSPACPHCRCFDSEWVSAPEVGQVFSYTIVRHPLSDLVRERVPYNIVVVEFPGVEGVRLVSNVVDLPPENIQIGMPVRLIWEPAENGIPLPRFTGRS